MACERNHQTGGRLGKIDSPRTLPTCEGGHKPFKIGELFDVENNWIYGKNKQYQTRFAQPNNTTIPVVSGITTNNGVNYYTADTLSEDEIFCDCLTISTRGEYSGTVTYHDGKFCLANNILVMQIPKEWTKRVKLYLAALISKLGFGGYNNYPRKETLKEKYISLPTTATGDIDFAFMEERVRELEKERVRELEVYLKAAGFEDCTLSAAEHEALSILSGGISIKEFKIYELFEKPTLGIRKKFIKKEDVSTTRTAVYNLPLVNAKHGNNGIMYYGKECDFDSVSMSIDIVGDGAISTGDVYPQPDKTGVLYNAYLIRPKQEPINEPLIVYFAVAIQKAIKHKYGYDNKATWEKVQRESISLPVTADGAIDYGFMETAIRAMEKQCIARLKVAFAREHEAYMQVIS